MTRPPVLGAIALSLLVTLSAQAPPGGSPGPTRDQVHFERYVPDSAGLFVTIRQLGEVDDALHRANVWGLLPSISAEGGSSERPFDLRSAIVSLLGGDSAVGVDELMGAEVGIAARAWAEIGSAVWLIRIPDPDGLRRWFPQQRIRSPDAASRRAVTFRTKTGVSVCVRGDVVAMARPTHEKSLLPEVRLLMSGRARNSLEGAVEFRELASYMPGRELALAYITGDASAKGKGRAGFSLFPGLDRAVVGLYERGGRIDLAIRGSVATPRALVSLEPAVLRQVMSLPQTTLLAVATTVDFGRAYVAATQGPAHGDWKRYLSILAGLAKHAAASPDPAVPAATQVIVVWGQDLSEHGSTPQLAVLAQSTDPQALRASASRVAGKILTLARMSDPEITASTLAIKRRVHLGTVVEYLPLDQWAADSQSTAARLLARVAPAWAAWRDWFIIALSREHLERILDSWHGLIPSLAAAGDLNAVQTDTAPRTLVAVVQPQLATDMLDRWVKDCEAGLPSLLAPAWWAGSFRSGALAEEQLGVRLRCAGEPGTALVTRVPPDSIAHGRLQLNDRVIGVGGTLLDLGSPGATLDRKLALEPTSEDAVLRVRRGDLMIDVTVPCNENRDALAVSVAMLTGSVRELSALGRTLQSATLSVHAAGEEWYSARVSLRFAPSAAP